MPRGQVADGYVHAEGSSNDTPDQLGKDLRQPRDVDADERGSRGAMDKESGDGATQKYCLDLHVNSLIFRILASSKGQHPETTAISRQFL